MSMLLLGFPSFFSPSWGLACPLCDCSTQGHARALTHSTHAGVGRTEGLAGGGAQGSWTPHRVSLTHVSFHFCSPRSPATSPLCVLQVARQVSGGTKGHQPGPLAPFPGSLGGVTAEVNGALYGHGLSLILCLTPDIGSLLLLPVPSAGLDIDG